MLRACDFAKHEIFHYYYLRNLYIKLIESYLQTQMPKHYISKYHPGTVFEIPYRCRGISSYQLNTVVVSGSRASLIHLHTTLLRT